MKKLPKDPSAGTSRHRGLLSALADSVGDQAMRKPLASPAQRRAMIVRRQTEEAQARFGKHSARVSTMDGWSNFLTGLGVSGRDKRTANYAAWGLTLQETVAEDLFASDSLARRIVTILPEDATREGIEWEDKASMDGMAEEMERLQLIPRETETWNWGRLYGGGGIFVNDGTPVERLIEPLRPDALDKIVSLVSLTRWELWAWATDMQRDLSKPDFGLPERYHIYPRMAFGQQAITVHASRIIRFDGRRLPRLLHIRNNFWGDSVLTPIYDVLGDFNVTHHALANVMQDFRLVVHKIKKLTETINMGGEAAVIQKINLLGMLRSVMGTMVVDGGDGATDTGDDITMSSAPLTGVADVVDKLCALVCAKTDIPHNILFNEAPGGARSMGSSGDAEEKAWYNTVKAQQKGYLKPRHDQLCKLIFAQRRGPFKGKEPKNWKYLFPPLWQLDDKDKTAARLANTQADDLEITNGVRTNVQVQAERYPELAVNEPATLLPNPAQQQLQSGEDPNDHPTPSPAEGAPGSKGRANAEPEA